MAEEERRQKLRPRRPSDAGPDDEQRRRRPRRPPGDEDEDERRRHRPRRPRPGDEDDDERRRHRSRSRRPPGEGGDDDERRRHRPRRPPGEGDEHRKHRPRRPRDNEDGDEHRKRRPRRPPGEGGDEDDRRRRRPRRPPDEDGERGRSHRKSPSRSGEERRGNSRSVSVSQRGTRKIRKPRPPEDMDEEELRRWKARQRRKQREMEESVGTLDSNEDLDEEEMMKRKMRRKKQREQDESGTIGSAESMDSEPGTPGKMKRRVKKVGEGSENGDVETPRTRKKKLRPPDDPSKSSLASSTNRTARKKVLSTAGSKNSKIDQSLQSSAAAFDVEAFVKRQQVLKQEGKDSDANGIPAGFDVADFVKRQQANKNNNARSQEATAPPPPDYEKLRAEDAKKIASLEAQIDSLNKQMEQQELELVESLSEVAAHEETRRELERLQEQLDGREREDDYGGATSASMDMLTEQIAQQEEELERARSKLVAGEEAQKELLEIQNQFNVVIDEKDDLLKALDGAEREMLSKDQRIIKLEQAIESQLDTIEALEEKLEITEDELFQMEQEIKGLENQGILDESVHSKKRDARLDTMRKDRLERSLHNEKSNTKSLLSSSSHHAGMTKPKSSELSDDERLMQDLDNMEDEMKRIGDEFTALKSGSGTEENDEELLAARKAELDEREEEIAKLEQQLDESKEQDRIRSLRLEEWENDLVEKEAELKTSAPIGDSDDLNHTRRELDDEDHLAARKAELDEREEEIAKLEQQLDESKEQDRIRSLRLEEWENDLVEKEEELNTSVPIGDSDDLDHLRRELKEREQALKENHKALEREREELAIARSTVDNKEPQPEVPVTHEIPADFREEIEEKDQEIADLKEACQRLQDEKVEMIRSQEEEDIQRDEELRRIQQDIHSKLKALDEDNRGLRTRLEEAEQKALKVSGLQKVINLLEDEVRSLRRMDGSSGNEEAMAQHREGVARQLSELDEENQTLAEELEKQKRIFQETISEKEEAVSELRDMLRDTERKLQNASSGGGAFTASLLKEVSDLKQKLKASENGEGGAVHLAKELKAKEKLINELNESLMQMKLDKADEQADGDDERVMELESQIEAMKADFANRASRDTLSKLRDEIKSLKDTVRDLRKEIKTEKQESESRMKKKDESIAFFQAQMMKLTQDLARFEKREKNRPGFLKAMGGASSELQQQVEELEEEVDRWKTTNMQLADEIAVLKAERIELKNRLSLAGIEDPNFDDGSNDDGSIGSLPTSSNKPSAGVDDMTGSSLMPMSSPTPNGMGFMANANAAMRAPATSSASGPGATGQMAMRTLGGLWNAVKK